MRVIGGEFRSRPLRSVPGTLVRPTPDRLRETLFNVLAPEIDGCTFLDAYAGTGAVGIEALSRGAARAIFIEKNRDAAAIIRANLESLELTARARVIAGSARTYLGAQAAGIVFVDPPYEQHGEYEAVLKALGAAPPGLVVAQHDRRLKLEETYGALRRVRELRQGDNVLSFYRPAPES